MGDIQQNNDQVSLEKKLDEQYSNLMGEHEFFVDDSAEPGTIELSVPVKYENQNVSKPKIVNEKVEVEKNETKPNLPEMAFVEASVDSDGIALTIPPHKVTPHNAELDVSPKYIKPQGMGVDVLNNNFGEDNGDGEIDAADVTITDFEKFDAENKKNSDVIHSTNNDTFINTSEEKQILLSDDVITPPPAVSQTSDFVADNVSLVSPEPASNAMPEVDSMITDDVVQEALADNVNSSSFISNDMNNEDVVLSSMTSSADMNEIVSSTTSDVLQDVLSDNVNAVPLPDMSATFEEKDTPLLQEFSSKELDRNVSSNASDVVQDLLSDNVDLTSPDVTSDKLLGEVSLPETSSQEWEYVEVDSSDEEQEWEYVEVAPGEDTPGWEYVEVDSVTQEPISEQKNEEPLLAKETTETQNKIQNTVTPPSEETPNFLHGWSDFGDESESEILNDALVENNSLSPTDFNFSHENTADSITVEPSMVNEMVQNESNVSEGMMVSEQPQLNEMVQNESNISEGMMVSEQPQLNEMVQNESNISESLMTSETPQIVETEQNVEVMQFKEEQSQENKNFSSVNQDSILLNENSLTQDENVLKLNVSNELNVLSSENNSSVDGAIAEVTSAVFEDNRFEENRSDSQSDNFAHNDSEQNEIVDVKKTEFSVKSQEQIEQSVNNTVEVSPLDVAAEVAIASETLDSDRNYSREVSYNTYHFNAHSGIQNFVAKEKNGCICLDCARDELKNWHLICIQTSCQELSAEQSSLTVPLKQAVLREAKILQPQSKPLILYNVENYDFQKANGNFEYVKDKIISNSFVNKAVFLNDFVVQSLSSLATNYVEYSSPQIGVLIGPEGAFLTFAGVLKIIIPEETEVKQSIEDNLKRIAKRYAGHLSDHYANYSAANLEGNFIASDECKAIHLNLGKSSYGWSVHFDNGLVLGLADVREYQLRNGKLPMNEGTIVYGNKKLKFSGCERIVIYKEAEYFSYR